MIPVCSTPSIPTGQTGISTSSGFLLHLILARGRDTGRTAGDALRLRSASATRSTDRRAAGGKLHRRTCDRPILGSRPALDPLAGSADQLALRPASLAASDC